MLLLCMVFMHILDDYYLQGVLKELKQKAWREKNHPAEMYKHDYIVALLAHAFSWTFCIMLPIAVNSAFNVGFVFYVTFFIQMAIHALVDDLKANKLKINLITDQTIHLLQIVASYAIYLLVM